jgi:hypothetical protein
LKLEKNKNEIVGSYWHFWQTLNAEAQKLYAFLQCAKVKTYFCYNIYQLGKVIHFFLTGKVFIELSRVLHWTELSFALTLSLLSLPAASHLCHHAWLTMHNCEIYNSSAVNYEPETTYLIFIRVNNYQGSGKRGLQLISLPVHFTRVTIYSAASPYNIAQVTIHPVWTGGGGLLLILRSIYFIRDTTEFTLRLYPTILKKVTIYPARFTSLFWLVLYEGHYFY